MIDVFMMGACRSSRGLASGGIPIGSVIVRDGMIIGRGHNRRVQEANPMKHAEIDCLINAGRVKNYRNTTLYSTLMPCYLCAGAIVQFNIPKVCAGEARTFPGAAEFMRSHGVEVVNLDLDECAEMMEQFIRERPDLWNEDIGK
jgi:cytosine deaminase